MVQTEISFVADVHLVKLAKYLRMLGFNTVYQNNYPRKELESIAVTQNRLLLSRNPVLAQHEDFMSFILAAEDPLVQLQQTIQQFELGEKFKPFTRCILCNGLLHATAKEKIENQLREATRKYYNEFWQCSYCLHLYWKGSHYERMEKLIAQLKGSDHK